jgi:hypothetical protein
LPLKPSEPYTSYSFIKTLSNNPETPFLPRISRFNPATQSWESTYYYNDEINGLDFPVTEGEGYSLKASSDTVYTFTGNIIATPITLNLKRGNNLIGIPYSAEKYTSYTLLQVIPNCVRIMRYNADNLSWDKTDKLGGADFEVKAGEGYYVYVTQDTSWTPGSIAAPIIIPERMELAQNYPNPFNPETWIPFQLANPSKVNIRIYNATGRLVKSIPLGYKQAGMYVEKSKAAYWDGRNDVGEKVSSGIYFYELRTENFRDIRKMIVLK